MRMADLRMRKAKWDEIAGGRGYARKSTADSSDACNRRQAHLCRVEGGQAMVEAGEKRVTGACHCPHQWHLRQPDVRMPIKTLLLMGCSLPPGMGEGRVLPRIIASPMARAADRRRSTERARSRTWRPWRWARQRRRTRRWARSARWRNGPPHRRRAAARRSRRPAARRKRRHPAEALILVAKRGHLRQAQVPPHFHRDRLSARAVDLHRSPHLLTVAPGAPERRSRGRRG